MKRRDFVKTGAAAAMTAASATRVLGANSRVRMALIGCGGRGKSVAHKIDAVDNVEYVAMCDVYDKQAAKAKQEFGGTAKTFKDFRTVLDRKDIDAVHIATPDHWHAIPAVMACHAGKHVYCEKPLTHNILEGKEVVKAAAANTKAVFLTGTQHRSAPHFAEVTEMIQGGTLRDVHFVRVWNYANLMPNGTPETPDQPVPEGLDWDFYLGPAPWVPFNRRRFLRSYRAFFDYAGGWITDFGIHRFDTVHQIMGREKPTSANATGGRFAVGGMSDQPDILQVTYEYPGFVMSYETINTNSFGSMGRLTKGMIHHGARGEENRPNGMVFYGSNGTIIADRLGYETLPEAARRPNDPYGNKAKRAPNLERTHKNDVEPSARHAEHFIRCIRDGEKPRTDAVTGHRASLIAHLGNISFKVGRKLRWDPEKEDIIGDAEASHLLGRKARKPWDMITT